MSKVLVNNIFLFMPSLLLWDDLDLEVLQSAFTEFNADQNLLLFLERLIPQPL